MSKNGRLYSADRFLRETEPGGEKIARIVKFKIRHAYKLRAGTSRFIRNFNMLHGFPER